MSFADWTVIVSVVDNQSTTSNEETYRPTLYIALMDSQLNEYTKAYRTTGLRTSFRPLDDSFSAVLFNHWTFSLQAHV